MNTITQDTKRTSVVRRAKAATLVGVATVAAGVPTGLTFAAEPEPDSVAGEAVVDLAEQGASFVGTYAVPAAIIAIGASIGLALLIKLGRRMGRLAG